MRNNSIKKPGRLLLASILVITMTFSACEFPPSEFEIGQTVLNSAYDLQLAGDVAYVTYNEGVAIIDISTLSDPEHISNIDSEEACFGILVKAGRVYVGGDASNISIINVEDINSPEIISSKNIPGAIYDAQKKGSTVFLSTWQGDLLIMDVSNPEDIAEISSLDCDGNGTNLAYHNDVVYYANAQKGLQIIDVSDLESPVISSLIADSHGAWDIDIDGGYLFLGRHNQGFSIYKINEDNTLQFISSRNNGGEAYGIAREGDSLYIADLIDGVEVWDISDISAPVLVKTIEEYSPHDIVVRDGIVFLADQDRDFVILDRNYYPPNF